MFFQKHTYVFSGTPCVCPYALWFSYFHAALRLLKHGAMRFPRFLPFVRSLGR